MEIEVGSSRVKATAVRVKPAGFLMLGLVLLATLVPAKAFADAPLSWSAPESIDNAGARFNGVSCPSTALCVGATASGDIVTSTNPSGGASAWTVTEINLFTGFNTITCPSASLCVAYSTGRIVTSTNPTGGSGEWTFSTTVDTNDINAISCPTTSFCVAVDSVGNVLTSTNPTGGAAAWTTTSVDSGESLGGISCPTTGLCVAADSDGRVVTSTDPTGGAGEWTVTPVSGGFLSGVACPTTAFCVAGESNGIVDSSHNPTGGESAWKITRQAWDAEPDVKQSDVSPAISCQSVNLCVIGGYYGELFTSTEPDGGEGSWTANEVDGSSYIGGVSCPSASLCVAVDGMGNLIVGTPALSHQLTVSKAGTGTGTVTSSPAGINCGGACANQFTAGLQVSLTATPAGGSTFTGWSGGGCSGTGACEVTLAADTDVTATFDAESPSGGGESSGGGGSTGDGGSGPSALPSSTPHVTGGVASAGGTAAVAGGSVALDLQCPMGDTCSGVLKLIAEVSSGPVTKRHGKRHPSRRGRQTKRKRQVVIGKHAFSIASGHSATVKVPLNAKGKAMLRHAGKHGLTVRLAGSGVRGRVMHLKPVRSRTHQKVR